MLQHFQLLYFSLIVWKALKKKKQQNSRSEKNCKARSERNIIIKTCTHKRNVNSFEINFAPLLCVPFCRQRTQTISIVWAEEKKFLRAPKKKKSSCRLFAIQKEPENYFSLPFMCQHLFGISCMQWCLAASLGIFTWNSTLCVKRALARMVVTKYFFSPSLCYLFYFKQKFFSPRSFI